MAKVLMYSTGFCPFCVRAEKLLASKGVSTQEELADHATDDLVEATGLDEERAKTLIMAARAPWFAENNA